MKKFFSDPLPDQNVADDAPAPLWTAWLLAAAIVLYLAFALALLRRPILWWVGVMADDGFYYLGIARHLATIVPYGQTGVPTFDGVNPTNGYHPGWLFLLAVCAKIFPGRDALLRACAALSLGLHLATALLLLSLLRSLVGAYWARIGAVCWLLNPFAIQIAVQGVESPLALCTFALVIWVYLRRIDPHLHSDAPFHPPPRDLILFGLSLGAAFWARTDFLLLAIVTLLTLGFAIPRLARPRPLPPALFRALALIAGTFLLVILPWLLYSYLTVGTIQQDSGVMKALWAARERARLGPAARLGLIGEYLNWAWLDVPINLSVGNPSFTLAAKIALLFLLAALFATRRAAPPPALLRLHAWLLPYLALNGVLVALVLTDHQMWYAGPPALVFFLLVLGWLSCSRPLRSPQSRAFAGAACLAVSVALFVKLWLRAPILYPWQQAVYTSQPRFDRLVPPGARIGCFNAGIPVYFSRRQIIALDGLVNHNALRYWRADELDRYLRDARIAYIADAQDALIRPNLFVSHPLAVQTVASAPLPGWRRPMRFLWRVLP